MHPPSTPSLPLSPPPALHQPTPAIFTPHTSVVALRRLLAQQLNRLSNNRAPLLLPLLLRCLSPSTPLAVGPQRRRGPSSPLARLFIETSMELYAASARPCPRRHQSSSAPGLLSLPRQPANHSFPGSYRRWEEKWEERKYRISLCLLLSV